jgi:hypothetical protein
MSEEDKTLETVVKMLSTCIEQRDEARARAAEWEKNFDELNNGPIEYGYAHREAEARGFERGVREAAEAAWRAWTASNDVGETGGKMHGAILALLEPVTLQKPEA